MKQKGMVGIEGVEALKNEVKRYKGDEGVYGDWIVDVLMQKGLLKYETSGLIGRDSFGTMFYTYNLKYVYCGVKGEYRTEESTYNLRTRDAIIKKIVNEHLKRELSEVLIGRFIA